MNGPRAGVLVAVVAAHVVVLAGLLAYAPARKALFETAPLFVRLIAAPERPSVPEPPVPPPRPRVVPVRPSSPPIVAARTEQPADREVLVAPPPAITMEAAPAPVAPTAPPAPRTPLFLDELALACPDRAPPKYPRAARRARAEGRVVLRVELDESGRVANAGVATSSGSATLDDAALAAVRTWRCTPPRRGGVAVRATALQPFNFVLGPD
jgi:protein TonB